MKGVIRAYTKNAELVAKRREHIARCAARLFVRKGFKDTNVREIAEICGMSKGNLYNYVGSKEDILYLVIERAMIPSKETIKKLSANQNAVNPTDVLRQFIRSMCRMTDESQDFIVFTYQETKYMTQDAQQKILDLEQGLIEAIENLLKRWTETGDFPVDDPMLTAHNILLVVEAWAFRRWFLGKRYSLEEYIEKQTEFIVRAISAKGGALTDKAL